MPQESYHMVEAQNIQDFLQMRESETVEFKEKWEDNSGLKALSAFANTRGGLLLVGVTDDHQLGRWKVSDRELEQIVGKIHDVLRIHPQEIQRISAAEDSEILLIKMPVAPIPMPFLGRYYRRVGNSSREILPSDLGNFLLERLGTSWDSLIGEYKTDIDDNAIETFVKLARNRLPSISTAEETRNMLEKLRLIVDGKLTRAAVFLFTINPQLYFPNTQVRIGRFKDAVTMVDDKIVDGNLWQQVDSVMKQLMQYIQVRYEIPKEIQKNAGLATVQRREIWDYPIDGLREAVMNALVHRDYMSMENIHIRVFDDRVVITNPGGLPEGLTIEDLKKDEHPSVPRNPLLAQVVYYANLIEKWGTGITRLRTAFRDQGLLEPEFEASSTRFAITLHKGLFQEKRILDVELTEQQKKVIVFVKENGKITNKDYRQITGQSDESARVTFKDLMEKGVLKNYGKGRSSHYKLNEVGD